MLSVKVIDNVRIPSFRELEIFAQVKVIDTSGCYMLESNLQHSDLLVARAVVIPGEMVPIHLLNPTGGLINLYMGTNVAVLSEVMKVMDNHSEEHSVVEDTVMVSADCSDNECVPLEEMLVELVS